MARVVWHHAAETPTQTPYDRPTHCFHPTCRRARPPLWSCCATARPGLRCLWCAATACRTCWGRNLCVRGQQYPTIHKQPQQHPPGPGAAAHQPGTSSIAINKMVSRNRSPESPGRSACRARRTATQTTRRWCSPLAASVCRLFRSIMREHPVRQSRYPDLRVPLADLLFLDRRR